MQRTLWLGILLVVGIIAWNSPAAAQLRPWEISIAGGPTWPTGDFADVADTGYHVEGAVGFDLPGLPLGLRADAFWQELPDGDDEWFRQIGVLLNVTLGIPLVIIEPYALAGLGYLRTEMPESSLMDDENLVGFNAGAGVEFPFMGLSGFLEARYLNAFGGDPADQYRTIPVTVGIRF